MNTKLLPKDGKFQLETFTEMSKRYTGFGNNLFTKLLSDEPQIKEQIKFYKRIDSQLEDSYALVSNPNMAIAIQLDPLCEVIIIWNNNVHIEKGHWTENLIQETINSIKSLLKGVNR